MMKLRVPDGSEAGRVVQARITTDHPASREGVPILLVTGEPVPVLDAAEAGYEVVSATPGERAALFRGGYRLAGFPGPAAPA